MDKSEQAEELQNLERRLQAWATRDLSDDAKSRCNDLIDRLAGAEASYDGGHSRSSAANRKPWLWSSAAAITLGLLVWLVSHRQRNGEAAANLASAESVSGAELAGFTLLRSVNRVDARADDGLIIPDDGAAPYYRYRYHMVDEEQVQDKESGAVITLRQPRIEIVTVPVTQF